MIVHQINVEGVPVLKPEDDTVIGTDSHGMKTFQVALESVQTKAWEIQIFRGTSPVQHSENVFDLLDIISAKSLPVTFLEKPF
ncbi:MAG TPA: hypothetical protein VFU48_09510 [Nitrospira sp.]|nr:hypothetical protein [Nitrospira sp.]